MFRSIFAIAALAASSRAWAEPAPSFGDIPHILVAGAIGLGVFVLFGMTVGEEGSEKRVLYLMALVALVVFSGAIFG